MENAAQTHALNKYSSRVTQPKSQGASQAMLYGTGLTEADMNKAQVGIVSNWYEGNPCNMHLDKLAAREWRHAVSGEPIRVGVSTFERWYYRARKERHDPVGVLRRKPRSDAGQQASMRRAAARIEALGKQ